MSAAPEPNSDGSAIPELYYTGFLGLYVIGLHNGRKGIGFVWSWNGEGENILEFELGVVQKLCGQDEAGK